jgi:hypothetical protein
VPIPVHVELKTAKFINLFVYKGDLGYDMKKFTPASVS